MKIEFQNSIRRVFVPSVGHQNCFNKSLDTGVFPVSFANSLRAPILQNQNHDLDLDFSKLNHGPDD